MEPIARHEAWSKGGDKHDQQKLMGEQVMQSTASHEWESWAGHDHQKGEDNDATEQSRNHQRMQRA